MYDVATRKIGDRSLLCLKRHVDGVAGAWALGKECIGIFRDRPLALMDGIAGASFCIYHGEVNEDSDGPIEWCRPVPGDQAEAIAGDYPELTLRTEPAHEEAFVHLGPGGQTSAAQWQLVSESLFAWNVEHRRSPSDLGVRITFLVGPGVTAGTGPDCDFAVPIR